MSDNQMLYTKKDVVELLEQMQEQMVAKTCEFISNTSMYAKQPSQVIEEYIKFMKGE